MMQEESCNVLGKTLANGLLGTSRISVKPQLVLLQALLGLCWHHSPPVLMFPGLSLDSGVRDVLYPCVLNGLLSLLGWLLAEMGPEKSCHLNRNGPCLH